MAFDEATVFVIDDHEGMRKSLCYLIESAGLRVETYPSADAFLRVYEPSRCGCLVVDVRMPGMTGLELLTELAIRGDYRPAIVLTGYGDVPTAVTAMKAGAVDFMEKPFDDALLLERIHRSIGLDQQWRDWRRTAIDTLRRLNALTPREREVYDLVVAGKQTAEIARTLGLSQQTVKSHRGQILRKMRVRSTVEMVRMASSCASARATPLHS